MHLDDLRSHLADAIDAEPAADLTAGRHAIDRRVRRHQTRRRTAVAMAVLVLLGGIGVRVGRTGQGEQVPVISGPVTLTRLAPAADPVGLELSSLRALPLDGIRPMAGPTSTFVYVAGEGADAEAFAVIVLRYDLRRAGQEASAPTGRSGTVRIEGRAVPVDPDQATTSTVSLATTSSTMNPVDAAAAAADLYRRLLAIEHVARRSDATRGTEIVVASRTMSDASLDRIAGSIVLNDAGNDLTSIDVPGGFRALPRSTSFGLVEGDGLVTSVRVDGALLTYIGANGEEARTFRGHHVAIASLPAHGQDLDALRWFLADARPTRLHGADGIVGTFRSGSAQSSSSTSSEGEITPSTTEEIRDTVAAWVEPDGTLMVIQASGVTTAEVQQIADALQPIDESAWHALQTKPEVLPEGCVRTSDGITTCATAGSVVRAGTTTIP